jgi:hypothetical protein
VVVGSVAADSFGWTGPAGSPASACLGDAGGPVFRAGGSRPELVGLNVRSGQGGCLSEPQSAPSGATAARVDDIASWITSIGRSSEPGATFVPHLQSTTGIGEYDLADGRDQVVPFDYDHSGKLDHLLVYRPGTGIVHIVKQNRDGYASIMRSTTGIGGYDLLGATDRIVPFDYNHSGKLDHLVLYRPGSRTVFVLRHDAGNTFTPVYSSTTAGIGTYTLEDPRDQMLAYDYDRSGKPDHLLVYRPQTGLVSILKHGAGNSFSKVFASTTGIGGYDLLGATDRIVAFDYDHSGKLDHLVLYRPGSRTVFVLRHDAGNTFTPVFSSTTGIGGYDLAETRDQLVTYDYDYSGRLDHLVLYRPGAGIVHILKHDAGNSFSPVFSSTTGIGGYDLRGANDRIVAFDGRNGDSKNLLFLHRPGSRIAWTADRFAVVVHHTPVTFQPTIGPDAIIEDFRYPGAESIEDIELIRGDGRIMLVECTDDPALITVESVGREVFCFRVTGDTGWLSLRLDRVFLVGAGDQTVAATITANGAQETVTVPEGQVRPTGTTDPDFAVLLELRATP